jgi:diguanylate cyclase (GGDEF)-like protein/PAS domain S-box-containing protein
MIIGLTLLVLITAITFLRIDDTVNKLTKNDLATLKLLSNVVIEMGEIQNQAIEVFKRAQTEKDEEMIYSEVQKVLDRTRNLLAQAEQYEIRFTTEIGDRLMITPKSMKIILLNSIKEFLSKHTSAFIMVTVDPELSSEKMSQADGNYRHVVQNLEIFSREVNEQLRQEFLRENRRVKNENIIIIFIFVIASLIAIRILISYVRNISNGVNDISDALDALSRDSDAVIPDYGKHSEINNMIMSLKKYKNTQIDLNKTLTELTDIKENLEQLVDKRTKQLKVYENIVQNTDEAIYITDVDANIIKINEAFEKITGYDKDEILGKNVNLMTLAKNHNQKEVIKEHLKKDGSWSGEMWNTKKDGTEFPMLLTINVLYDQDNNIMHYLGIFRDITHIKESEKKLEAMAYYDNLTKLANRALFIETLKNEIKYSLRANISFAILYIDLDGFKAVNDTMGHQEGDHILQEVAQRLKNSVRDSDICCRMGGDEFTVLLKDTSSREGVQALADKIIYEISQPIKTDNSTANVSASIGVAIFPEHSKDINSLITTADTAMYKAKQAGKGIVKFA